MTNDARAEVVLLLGSTRGWSMAAVANWLFSEAVKASEIGCLLLGLGKTLVAAGAPLCRIRLGFFTAHPQLAARAFNWYRDDPDHVHTHGIGHDIRETTAFIGSPAEHIINTGQSARYDLTRLQEGRDHPVLFEMRDQGGTDYFAIPMRNFTGKIEHFFLTTDRSGGFEDDDIAKFEALAKLLLPVLDALVRHQISVELLNTYVGPRTGRQLLAGKVKRGDGDVIRAAIWFSDLRDSTLLGETLSPPDLLETLNDYFSLIYEAVKLHGGEVLRFIGDAMLIIFPADSESEEALHRACEAALAAAREAIQLQQKVNQSRWQRDLPPIRFGIGLHEGSVIYGNVGAPARLDFTVTGPAVNRAARIEFLTKETGQQVLVSASFAGHVTEPSQSIGDFNLKGVPEAVTVHQLMGDWLE